MLCFVWQALHLALVTHRQTRSLPLDQGSQNHRIQDSLCLTLKTVQPFQALALLEKLTQMLKMGIQLYGQMLHHLNLERETMWDHLSPQLHRGLCSPIHLNLRKDQGPLMDLKGTNLLLEDPEGTLKQEDHGGSLGMSLGVLLVILNHRIGVNRALMILDTMVGISGQMMVGQISEGLLEIGFMGLIGRAS